MLVMRACVVSIERIYNFFFLTVQRVFKYNFFFTVDLGHIVYMYSHFTFQRFLSTDVSNFVAYMILSLAFWFQGYHFFLACIFVDSILVPRELLYLACILDDKLLLFSSQILLLLA